MSSDGVTRVSVEIAGSEFDLDCDLVLLALGFLGPESDTVISQLGCELTERGNLKAGPDYQTTVPGVFACGGARCRRIPDGRDVPPGEPGAVADELVCRYVLRPPVAQQRLRLTGDGRVLVTLKEEWRDGTTHLLLERVELLERARPSRPPILPPSCRLHRSPAARRHPWWPGSD